MARISIYVPDDLKAEMAQVGDAVNWSEVVRPSIHSALASYKHRSTPTMQTTIERLRASKAEATEHDVESGKKDGREWARDVASYKDLKAMSRISTEALENYPEQAVGICKKMLDPSDEMDRREFAVVWFSDSDPSAEYLLGFVSGAQEVYEEVADKI